MAKMGNIRKATRYYLFRERVNISKRVNGFLYFLRKLPLVGKKISPNVYQSYGLKHILFILVAIASVLMAVATKGLMIGFYAGLVWTFDFTFHAGTGSMDFASYIWAGLFLWFMMTFFINNVYNTWFSQVDPKTLEFMDNFHLSKKFFIKAKTLIDGVINGVYYFPIAILLGWLTDSWMLVLALPVLYMALTFLGYYLSRIVLSGNKIALMTQSFIIIGGVVFTLAIGILVPIFTDAAWIVIIFSPIIIAISLLVALGCFFGILKFKREDHYLAVVLDRSTAISEGAKNIAADTTTNVQKKMTVTDSRGRFEDKKGNAYLNAILFDRYKKEFRKILRTRLIATGVIVLAFFVINQFWSDFLGDATGLIPLLNIIFIPMWISMFSVGRKMVQIVFLNCDNAMLHYPFYREKSVILSGFLDRLKRTFMFNSVLALAPLLMWVIIGFSNEMDFSFLPMTLLILITVIALFSFHDLFLYYILQPFAGDMQVKSPMYFIINMASSMVVWMVVGGGFGGGTDLMSLLFESQWQIAIILAILTVVYVGLGMLALHKFASKTFKARG